jgi:putative Ca2+/H+ antiporter (TMEM165/GDT1 family)
VHLFSVFVGEAAGMALSPFWINLLAGLAFIGFGIWTLRGDSLDDGNMAEGRFGPLMTVAAAFFLAELGDKTMLMTITIASQERSFIAVWLGSSLGMVMADAIAIIIGILMGKSLPQRLIKFGAAAVFILSGIVSLYQAFAAE